MLSTVSWWAWAVLAGTVVPLLALDLFLHRGDHQDSWQRSLGWSIAWIAVALLFDLGIALTMGADDAKEFLSAYLLEKTLSVDNLFVFLVIFRTLGIPSEQERRVLSWGVFGALVTRGAFIAFGTVLLTRWQPVVYFFALILVVTGIRMLRPEVRREDAKVVGHLRRFIPFSPRLDGHRFLVRDQGKLVASPLLLALVAVELTDVVFAVDSIPAAFAVTREPFIVYSSNIFALLGLRSLYIVLARTLQTMIYLRYGLAFILFFAGAKMIASPFIHTPPGVSLGIILVCLSASIVASLVAQRRAARARKSMSAHSKMR